MERISLLHRVPGEKKSESQLARRLDDLRHRRRNHVLKALEIASQRACHAYEEQRRRDRHHTEAAVGDFVRSLKERRTEEHDRASQYPDDDEKSESHAEDLFYLSEIAVNPVL